jgi:hypothetical protein
MPGFAVLLKFTVIEEKTPRINPNKSQMIFN